MKTQNLTGPALDWAVAKCLGYSGEQASYILFCDSSALAYSTDWAKSGPIIEREMLTVAPAKHEGYMAWAYPKGAGYLGDTPLIAAMRCYVASKMGDEIEVPEELR